MTDSNVRNLKERLQKKMETDRKAIEAMNENELQELTANLKNTASTALTTIEDDIKSTVENFKGSINETIEEVNAISKKLRSATLMRHFWAMLTTFTVGLSLFLVICCGSWGVLQYLGNQIKEQAQALEIAKRRTLEAQEAEATAAKWGITYFWNEEGRFIRLPKDRTASTGWKSEGYELVKLERRQ